jgi:hypothetical protein
MNTLHSQQMWEMMRSHQEDMLKEAQLAHLAQMAKQPRASWWKNLLHRPAQSPTLALNPSATPELG